MKAGQVVHCVKWKAYAKPGTMPHVDFVIRVVDVSTYPWKESQAQPALAVTYDTAHPVRIPS